MKRIVAFLIDYMILLTAGFVLINLNNAVAPKGDPLVVALGLFWLFLAYFLIADYKFKGMTLGKRLLGLRLNWDQGEGNAKLAISFLHIVFKWLLVIVWPLTLIIYLCLGGRMPYDRRLRLSYVQGPKAPLWKTLLKVAGGIAIFFALMFSVTYLVLNQVSKEEYYTVRDEKIPSVYTVLGKHRLAGYSSSSGSGVTEAQYQYVVHGDGNELLDQYMEYLIQNEGFARQEEDEAGYKGNVRVLERAGEDGCEITVLLVSSSKALTVKLLCEQPEN